MRPRAIPPTRRWCSCTASAARRGRGAASWILSATRYRAIAWDMPGYGGSAPLAAVSIAALADALQDFLQQVGATKPILVGHSIGGMIVQQLLANSPDIASAVVLAQTSPAFGKARRRLAEILYRAPGSARSIAAKRWFRWRPPW